VAERARPRHPLALIAGSLLLIAALLPIAAAPVAAAPTELFFSEYIEGSSNNKALEIYNGTGADVNLATAGYSVQMFFNGSAAAGLTINLTGTVRDGDVHVIAQSSAVAAILAQADQTNGAGWFNGDDAVALRKGTTLLDVIGQIGFDPGTEWGTGLTSTADNTLRRRPAIEAGDPNGADAFDPAAEWDGFATDTFNGLGVRNGDASGPSVTATSPANAAVGVAPSTSISITFSEAVVVSGDWFSIECATSGAHTAVTTADGPRVTYTLNPDTDFVAGERCTVTVVAANVTDTDTDDPPNEMAANHAFSFTTGTPAACTDPFTPIYEIQGSGASAAITGSVTTKGVVVGDFEGTGGLQGFYLQDAAGDENAATSDGIFVFTNADDVAPGRVVRVTGFARERFEQTSVNGADSNASPVPAANIVDCGAGSVTPTDVTMPFSRLDYPERFEGMLVRLPQPLVISEYFNYERFGELVLALPLDGETRPFTPTAIDQPGAPAQARAEANLLRRITLDDGLSVQNPSTVRHPNGTAFSLANRFRGGDTLTNTVGVLGFDFSLYRIQPTAPAGYEAVNPRRAAPEAVGGTLRAAAMNTLNFFLTLDYPSGDPLDNTCGPARNVECRGADSDQPTEFTRQRDKLLAAIGGLDGDVIGLNELENTTGVDPLGDPAKGIVPGLNARFGAGTYAAIDTGVIGTDAIRVGLIYRPAVVRPVGTFELLTSADDPRFIDTKSRPVLAQTFEETATGARFTVAVNHLKSKGSACDDVGDADTGDGQGNCNGTRTLAAQALVDWLATDPTGSGDPDFLILGDLNSYTREDPISAIKAGADDVAGTADDFTNLIARFQGTYAHSYVFDGQAGYLDHALSSRSLLGRVTGAADWHINSDEPDLLDYDTSFKPPAQDAIYEPNAYRSSDHDPVVIGLDPSRCAFAKSGTVMTLLDDCQTDETIGVPGGWTLDGAGHTITAVDPDGGHFVGGVIANEGVVAHVRNVTVTARDLADVCDPGVARLRGILFDGAAGSITDNRIVGLNQGFSGCQEGNAIEVRNSPLDASGIDLAVTISGNQVNGYQKTGIVANGSVRATIANNTVAGWGPTAVNAQNGIQIGFGGAAVITGNTVSGNFYTGPDVACGLLFFEADGVKQQANTLFANERDVCNFGRGGGNAKPNK
jgi:uncharacterized protein